MTRIQIILALLLSSKIAFVQEEQNSFKNEVSISYSILERTASSRHLNIQIARFISPKVKINLTYSTNQENSFVQSANQKIQETESILLLRLQQAEQVRNLNLKLGASYVFSDYFTLGGDFIFGQAETKSNITDAGYYRASQTSDWRPNENVANLYHEETKSTHYHFNEAASFKHTVLGIGLNAELLYPIFKKRVQLGFRYTPEIIYLSQNKATVNYQKDLLFKNDIGSYWDANSITSLVVKFRF